MDFAPYQDTDPGATRALSPPPVNRTLSPQRPQPQQQHRAAAPLPGPETFVTAPQDDYTTLSASSAQGQDYSNNRRDVSVFETSLPLRLDHEAMLAYILLPPLGGVLLLIMEHRSDYVRFHAWQSSLAFSAIFALHLVLSWSAVLSWMLFVLDILLIAFLSYQTYRDAVTLDRFELPFFGRLASSFVDSE